MYENPRKCIRSFDRTNLVNVVTLQWLSLFSTPFLASFGVTHPSCNPYCWPGPSGRRGVRWVWLASTTWCWRGCKGWGGHRVSDGPWRGTQWRACPLARSITRLFLSAQPEALPSTCVLLHWPKSGRVTCGVIRTGVHQLHGFTTAGGSENRNPERIPLSYEDGLCFAFRHRWLKSGLSYTFRVQLPHSEINIY